jgi:hypothetical protein
LPSQLLLGLSRPLNVQPHLEALIHEGLRRVYSEAQSLAAALRRDYISAQLLVDIGPAEMQTPELAVVDIQWADFGTLLPTDRVLGTYGLGLLKIAEGGVKTVILRPKVIAENLVSSVRAL